MKKLFNWFVSQEQREEKVFFSVFWKMMRRVLVGDISLMVFRKDTVSPTMIFCLKMKVASE